MKESVLILVVMEYGLRLENMKMQNFPTECLNPCCNGIWSQTASQSLNQIKKQTVLILVVMEYGLRPLFCSYGKIGFSVS